MGGRKRSQSECSEGSEHGSDASNHFVSINERPVDDISLEFFYKPHTLLMMFVCVVCLTYTAFTRDETRSWNNNVYTGLIGVTIFFMIVSILTLPNGPFTRPHPSLWRCILGISIMYLLLLQFLVHQDYDTIKAAIVWLDPKMANYTVDSEKEYGVDCWNITWARLYAHMDWFAFGHYWGWGMKALIIRHYGLLWSVSIMWELTEMVFGHLLPNFYECWWDNLVLDVLVCNGLGIFTGMQVCKFLEMREFKWESIKNISGAQGKFKRALLQFTPESFTHNRWLDPHSGYMRLIAVIQFMLIWQMVELNTFFIKHIFPMPAEHPICVFRILLFGLISAPSTRQYYTYVTDPKCKRIGTQCWVFIMVGFSELILVLKFGLELFSHTQISMMMLWLALNILVSCGGVFVSMEIYKWRHQTVEQPTDMTVEDKVNKFLETSEVDEDEEQETFTRVTRTPTHGSPTKEDVRKRNVKLPA